jgi:hypothetical protein
LTARFASGWVSSAERCCLLSDRKDFSRTAAIRTRSTVAEVNLGLYLQVFGFLKQEKRDSPSAGAKRKEEKY